MSHSATASNEPPPAPSFAVPVPADSLDWQFNKLLANHDLTGTPGDAPVKDKVQEKIQDRIFNEALKRAPEGMEALESNGATILVLSLEPSVTANAVWNRDREINERLDAMLKLETGSDFLRYKFVPTPTIVPPPGPQLKAAPEADVRITPITTKEQIEFKAEALGKLVGLPTAEIIKRANDGLDSDLRKHPVTASRPH
jgi:hypothetical protein